MEVVLHPSREKIPPIRELLVLLLIALPPLVTVSAIEAAHWVRGLPSLKVILLVSLVAWALLARSGVSWRIGHPVALVAGLAVAFILSSLTLPDADGLSDLGSSLGAWFGAVGSEEGNRGASMMGLGLIAVTLWVGYASVWLAYRRSHALVPVLPGLGVLLVALTFLPDTYYWYFFMYLLAATSVIAYRHRRRWSVTGRRIPVIGTLAAGLILMGITLLPVWSAPAPGGVVIPLSSAFEGPWSSFREHWTNLFKGVPDRKQYLGFSLGRDLPFSDTESGGDSLMFVVESMQPYRWRMRVYETYASDGWFGDEAPAKRTPTETGLGEHVEGLKSRKSVEVGVVLNFKSRTLITVGEPQSATVPHYLELSPPPRFELHLAGPQVSYVPEEARLYRDQVVESLESETFDPDQFISEPPNASLLSDLGFRLASTTESVALSPQHGDAPSMVIDRSESTPGPTLALLGQRIMFPNKRYSTVGSVSQATPSMLRLAEGPYPHRITDRYLQLPPDFPETVKTLATELTREKGNSYEKAEAIRRYLQRLPFTLEFVAPPPGQDWVEFFLLEHQTGYSQNYASAMVTMLRSQGIPARMVVGFGPGILDPDREVWQVMSRHYHAWPEVYFPGYGWVEFEPTPSDVQPSLGYLGILPRGNLLDIPEGLDRCEGQLFGIFDACIENPDLEADGLGGPLDEQPQPETELSDEPQGGGLVLSPWTLLGIGLGLGLMIPVGLVSYGRWRVSRLGYVTAAYASMRLLGRLAGVRWRAHDTPLEYSTRLAQAVPTHGDHIDRITRGFVITRYGPSKSLAADEVLEVRAAWRTVRRSLSGRTLLRLVERRRKS